MASKAYALAQTYTQNISMCYKKRMIFTNYQRGVIHYFAILACILVMVALFYISQWNRQTRELSIKIEILEKSIESLESKVKFLDLKCSADDLVKR